MRLSALPGIPAPRTKCADSITLEPTTIEGDPNWYLPSLTGLATGALGAGLGAKGSLEVLKELSRRVPAGMTGIKDIPKAIGSIKNMLPAAAEGTPAFLQRPGVRSALKQRLSGINVAGLGGNRLRQHLSAIPHAAFGEAEGRKVLDWLHSELRSGKYGHKPGSKEIRKLLSGLSKVTTPARAAAPRVPKGFLDALYNQLQSFKLKEAPLGKVFGVGAIAPEQSAILEHLRKNPALQEKGQAALVEEVARAASKQMKPRGVVESFKQIPGRSSRWWRQSRGVQKLLPSRKGLLWLIPALLGGLGYMIGR